MNDKNSREELDEVMDSNNEMEDLENLGREEDILYLEDLEFDEEFNELDFDDEDDWFEDEDDFLYMEDDLLDRHFMLQDDYDASLKLMFRMVLDRLKSIKSVDELEDYIDTLEDIVDEL